MGRSVGILTAIGAYALGVSAILIPAGITPSSDDEASVFALSPSSNPQSQSIRVACPGCDFPFSQGHIDVTEIEEEYYRIQADQSNSLLLQFSISNDGEQLLLNDRIIYPLHLARDEVYVSQIPTSLSWTEIRQGNARNAPLEVTGSMVAINDEQSVSDAGESILPIEYRILELQHQPMDLDLISVNLLKTAAGQLLILQVATGTSQVDLGSKPKQDFPSPPQIGKPSLPKPSLPEPPSADSEWRNDDCSVLPPQLCRFMHMLKSKVNDCSKTASLSQDGQLPDHDHPHFSRPHHDEHDEDDEELETGVRHGDHHRVRPFGQYHGHHHHHHRHHRHHRHHMLHAFTRGVAAVLIPTMAGVVVGLGVSLFGLFVGRIISFVWIRLVRGGPRRRYAIVTDSDLADEEACLSNESKDVDGEPEEPPPVYEPAPAYEVVCTEQN